MQQHDPRGRAPGQRLPDVGVADMLRVERQNPFDDRAIRQLRRRRRHHVGRTAQRTYRAAAGNERKGEQSREGPPAGRSQSRLRAHSTSLAEILATDSLSKAAVRYVTPMWRQSPTAAGI